LIAEYTNVRIWCVQAETTVDAAMHTGANSRSLPAHFAVVRNTRSLFCCSVRAFTLFVCIGNVCKLLEFLWHHLGSTVTSAAVAAAEGVTASMLHFHVAAEVESVQ
jgi:hypothetical protein